MSSESLFRRIGQAQFSDLKRSNGFKDLMIREQESVEFQALRKPLTSVNLWSEAGRKAARKVAGGGFPI